MAYSTIDDVRNQLEEARLIQLTDDEGTGEFVEARVTQAICDADDEIDSYLGLRMRVPLVPAPDSVRRFSVDIAVYNLYSRREVVPENRAERYRNCVRFLESAASGKISLGHSDPEGNPLNPNLPEPSGENPARTFTRSSLTGF